jgi:hypothetical protein
MNSIWIKHILLNYLSVVVMLGACVGMILPPRISKGMVSNGAERVCCVPLPGTTASV